MTRQYLDLFCMPFCVGLTGGIGSGKSAASRHVRRARRRGGRYRRDLPRADGAGRRRDCADTANASAPQYVAADGGLDRARMRNLVFGDADAKRRLEGILHPLIRDRMRADVAAAPTALRHRGRAAAVRDRGLPRLLQRVLVVDCEEERAGRARVGAQRAVRARKCARSWRRSCRAPSGSQRADDVLRQ